MTWNVKVGIGRLAFPSRNCFHMRYFTLANILLLICLTALAVEAQENKRARDYGINIGLLSTGKFNAITDVPGVRVGQVTLIRGDSVRTGVTAILPHGGNIFQEKVPAAVYVGNGFGKLAGSTQVNELGNLETPIVLTNTLSVSTAVEALVRYTLSQKDNEAVLSVNAVVGETNDGYLNDIRGMHVFPEHVLEAVLAAESGPVAEGVVGAGTGTFCFGFKGGIGTSSRLVKIGDREYTVGVLVQTNFGAMAELQIDGAPVGKELTASREGKSTSADGDGSCMIIVATDAPVDHRNLKRIAKRGILGMGKTGGVGSNGSGDYVIAFSTAEENRVAYRPSDRVLHPSVIHNDYMTGLFRATVESTEEAIINSMFMAHSVKGRDGHERKALPLDEVIPVLRKYNRLSE